MPNLLDDGWNLKTAVTKIFLRRSPPVELGNDYTAPHLACAVTTATDRETWFSGGKLWVSWQFLDSHHFSDYYDLKLNYPRLITVPLRGSIQYSLYYEPPKWFTNINIKIWENTNMALYPDSEQTSLSTDTATVTTLTVSGIATPVSLLAANSGRKGYSIRNRGSKIALIGFSATFTPTSAFLTLADGAVYESDKLYLGALFGSALKAGESTDLTVTEFT